MRVTGLPVPAQVPRGKLEKQRSPPFAAARVSTRGQSVSKNGKATAACLDGKGDFFFFLKAGLIV